jgi:hypothetical protein
VKSFVVHHHINLKSLASSPKRPALPSTNISPHCPTLLGAIAASGEEADPVAKAVETIVLAVRSDSYLSHLQHRPWLRTLDRWNGWYSCRPKGEPLRPEP